MPPRLAHRKSRTGCRRCKERKVKCTEERPSCAACARHGVDCEYIENSSLTVNKAASVSHQPQAGRSPSKKPSPAQVREQPAAASSSSRSLSEHEATVSPPSGLDVPYSRNLSGVIPDDLRSQIELYLIHRFKSSVSQSFPSAQTPHLKDIYVWHATEAAFDHPYLLNAIFAVTALYLCMCQLHKLHENHAVQLPKALQHVDFAQVHRTYLNIAVSQERDELSSLGPHNADAVGLTSILLSIMSTCLLSDAPVAHGAEYSPPMQWLTLSAAVQTVFQEAVPYLHEGAMMSYMRASREPNLTDTDTLFHPNNTVPFHSILEFEDPDSPYADQPETKAADGEAYHSALAMIGSIFNAIRAGEPKHYLCMRVMAFGPIVPKSYVTLLAQKRARAMVILAYFMVLVKYLDSYWWFQGRAEKEILGIRSALPDRWQWALRWPLAVLANPEYAKSDPATYYRDISLVQNHAGVHTMGPVYSNGNTPSSSSSHSPYSAARNS
ncbi:uncharacterized protein PV06_04475 [Exophiala oligosperma]|uniref:Zn(2)-C6 fungal-type domain-containing protein n=2 Tax=Chaetothyriales TaxID=34395 RepID=A0A0D2E6D6_9EURO|nr:uncharacterized protein PV06_04475 [Exophiala oligosperma]KAJ9644891.1 hypothetical protein H2204_001353 [Knufia peltigerae]KIW43364.1 hypothetical protein PV06_04475 [Exophiala oligosperma]